MQDHKTFFFLHIPKCGGSSLVKYISSWFSNDVVCRVPNNEAFMDQIDLVLDAKVLYGHQFFPFTYILQKPVFIATFLRDPIQRTISAFEYIRRKKDHIYHEKFIASIKNISDFLTDDFFCFHSANMQTRMLGADYDLSGIVQSVKTGFFSADIGKQKIALAEQEKCSDAMLERAKYRLSTIQFFGVLDYFDESISLLSHQLSLNPPNAIFKENVASSEEQAKRMEYLPQEIKFLVKHNEYDLKLLEFAKDLFWKRYHSTYTYSIPLPKN